MATAYDTYDVPDGFDIFDNFVEDKDDDKYDKPSYTGSRGTGLYKKSLKALEKERERNKIRKEYPSLTDELADELIEKRKRNKGMLEWSEDLQRAVMTDELKKAHPEYTDEQIAEKVDYELGGTEMEIEEENPSDDTPSLEELKKQFPDVSEESLKEAMTMNSADWSDKTRKELFESSLRSQHPEWSEEQIMEQVNMEDPEYEAWRNEIRKGAKEDNPEWTDEQVDLYANRKANGGTIPDFAESYDRLIGDKYDNIDVPEIETEVVDLPPEDENEKEIVIDRNPDDTIVDPDKTLAEEITPDLPEGEDLTVIDNDPEDDPDIVTDEEVAAPDKLKKQPKQKDEPKQEEQEEDKTSSGYDRYPTGVRVGEDILGEVNTVAGGVKDVAEKIGKQGANSGSIANEVARAVPHYDYRSLFR